MSEPIRLYACRWAWCRLTFSDNDALGNHLVFEHVRRAIPVRRKDISMLSRAEEGLGDSLKISDIIHDPSSSLSKDPASSQQRPSSSPGLPSPSASNPGLPSQDQTTPEHTGHGDTLTDVHPTSAPLSSPARSSVSLKIPTSPAFSTLVHKRKEAFETPKHHWQGKRFKQDSLLQESESAASTGSQRSVEEHLTQSFERDDEDNSKRDAQGEDDIDDSQADRSSNDVVMAPPTSGTPSTSPSLLAENSQQDKGQLNWDQSSRATSELSLGSGQERNLNLLESMSQPPSQLQLSSPLYHIHRTKSSPSQLQTTQSGTDSSVLSLPLNPVALSPPTCFTFSTPQRQSWYQSARKRRIGSRSNSGENTPKPSSGTSVALPTVSEEQSQSQPRTQSPVRPTSLSRESPLAKKSGFRSGTLQVNHPSTSPLRQIQPQTPPPPQPIASPTISNAGVQDIFSIPEERSDSWDTQTQFDQQSLDISYPPLQTQAPYESQSLSQLD